MDSPGRSATPAVVLARRGEFSLSRLKLDRASTIAVVVSLGAVALFVLIVSHSVQGLLILLAVFGALALAYLLAGLYLNLRRTVGTAWADEAGVHWSGRWGSYAYSWPEIRWIELGRDQPGGTLFNALDPGSTVRTGRRIGVTVVVGTTPHYVHPVWTAPDLARIQFGCELAAYARSRGVPVRVLAGDWGPEDANAE